MRAIRLNRFSTEDESMDWIVDGLLPDVGWTLLIGLQGLGKTTLTLQLCAAIQAGIPFLNRKTSQRDILFIQADSPSTEWRQMVKRIAADCKGFTIVDVEPKCLNNPIYVDFLQTLIDKTKPGFIVFDSLYNLTSSQIGTEAVLTPVNVIKLLCGSIPFLLIHHPPHNEMRAAGHHSLSANCSNEWYLLKTKLKINKGRLVSTKEIALSRDVNGLWVPKVDDSSIDNDPQLQGSL